MTMNRLFRHTTSTLLRTALLLGVAVFVNIQQVKAQEMPDAFETVDPSTIIGNGKYYYIQFYEDLKTTCFDRAYLSDTGAGNDLWTKDYIPFAKNILWTLEATGTTNQFRLKSGEGNYIFLDSSDANKYKLTSDQGNATILTFYHRSDGGYEISTADNQNVSMCRDHRNVWAFVANYSPNNKHTYIGNCLRFAQLKDNIAHIIYYQDVDDFDPNGSGRYSSDWYRPHHYLTYSGSDWTSVIEEGGENACFLTKEAPATYPTPSAIISGAGRTGSGIVINSPTMNQYDHETQFFIRSQKPISAGKQIYLEFDYKASQNCHISTQAHGEPGSYQHHTVIDGGLDFTTSWNHFSGLITVSSEMAGTNGMQTIAFNLAMGSGTTFYFDNVVMLVNEPDTEHKFVSSRSSIYRRYSEWYPTAAAYHQDGLWTLEETSNSGEFSIKKYGGTDNEYITIGYQDVGICYGLGAQSNKATFTMENPNQRRYTAIKNTVTNKYINYTNGDGANVFDMNGFSILSTTGHTWYAGFLPVEVPVPNKDDFYQVVLRFDSNTHMVNENGGLSDYNSDNPDLWQIEQVDDYTHFHFRNPKNGKYLVGAYSMSDYYEGARVYSWADVMNDFDLEWRYVNPVSPETRVEYAVTHKASYLKQYAQPHLDKQGLATNADSDWMNEDETQKVNHFEITHYVKMGQTITVVMPTVLNYNNDHIYYQRFYHYNDETCDNVTYPDGTDIDGLKSHVSLSTSADGTVQYYLYNNGMVTGDRIYWETRKEGMKQNAQRYFNFTNSDGNAFTVAADVSRYSDYKYENPGAPLTDDLEEPSLTMRYIYYMKDAKVMATTLTGYPEQTGVADASAWSETGTVCIDDTKWMEAKEFHFPAKPVAYENAKRVGYRGEFIALRHLFSDYWVFEGGNSDENLVSAVNNANEGKIEVRIYDPNGTGIMLGGWNPTITDINSTTDDGDPDKYEGFYFYDKMVNKTSYGDSRFVVFRYPEGGVADSKTGINNKAYIHVYLNNNGTRYQLAQFTLIFDKGAETIPWKSVNGAVNVEGEDPVYVQGTNRDPSKLRNLAGRPIAKITFDYPQNKTYQYPASDADGPLTKHDGLDNQYGSIGNSSPIPLKFDNTNYAFDGDGCNWGSYALVAQKGTVWGNGKLVNPVDVAESAGGYGMEPDEGLQRGFLYIDASEQPGDICSADFQGEFCAGDKLMCSGWISGSNTVGGERCPGGITLTVKGERIEDGQKETIYRFCPGQCYELDNGTGVDGSTDGTQVVWQQFYFEFGTTKKYKRYWMEVNNNCVSSNGGDFMLDNVEVFALVPDVKPEMNTPVCVNKDASEMRLLKINLGFDKILAATNLTETTTGTGQDQSIAFVFLEKDVFLSTFQTKLRELNGVDKTIAELEIIIEKGDYGELVDAGHPYADAYHAAFNAAVLGDITKVWDSNSPNNNTDAGVLNFHWSNKFSEMETYSFAKAVNRLGAVFSETDPETEERFIVMNGNYPNGLKWKVNADYYIVPFSNVGINLAELYDDFNIFSVCSKKKVFQIKPPLEILTLESSDVTKELVVCEGKIPTVLTNLTGFDINGDPTTLTDLNFDWWLGDPANGVPATLDNYHKQKNSAGTVRLDVALSTLRAYYPGVTSLDGIEQNLHHTPNLTRAMTEYLQELVDKGQLLLHQKSVNVPAVRTGDDPYFYLVACPIHDEKFDQALNYEHQKDVAYFCDEPQGLRMLLGEKSPTLKCGFVKGENGYDEGEYEYPADNPVLSIRLAKKAQFMEVRHGSKTDEPGTDYNTQAESSKHFLWLPIRNAEVETSGSTGVIRKSGDYNVYLASTDDKERDQEIYESMTQTDPTLPIVGKIVQLTAIDTKGKTNVDQTSNRLCIYFIEDFDVREGYSYTLSLPFREDGDANTCDGTLLINMKIVPDYEVWTGAAGNTDWNNDQNWRRADGDKTNNKDELYVDNGTSLKGNYVTNAENYYMGKDRVFLKGFAPLYCTHVLMMKKEWGNAPVLYDALDGASEYSAKPFPNLRDKDNWDNNGAVATATPILKFDMQARLYDIWTETYESGPGKGRSGDLIAEMYQINTCDEIAFQPGTELRNAHLLNYNSAWVEYELDNKRWYLLGSPLRGTIAGEWYAPTGNAQQNTTYYEDVKFNTSKYDRYSPAIYQRSWDKAKAVLYEVGSTYATTDDAQTGSLGSVSQGQWSEQTNNWDATGADAYLDRLGYKPFGEKKANVAIKGIWSNTYNDAQVDYANGGFSVMVMNQLKGNDTSGGTSVIRLPKEDTEYEYWDYGKSEHGTNTYLVNDPNDGEDNNTVQKKGRALNRGRLKTDLLLPTSTNKTESAASRYGDKRTYTRIPIKQSSLITMLSNIRNHEETVAAGISSLGYYLVENPFPCGLDMTKFFDNTNNKSVLNAKYWILTKGDGQNPRQQLVQRAGNEWITDNGSVFTTANNVLAPGQGFFVQAKVANADDITVTFTDAMQAQSRFGVMDDGVEVEIEVGVKQEMKTVTETITMDDGTTQTITYEEPDYESDGITLKTSPITDYVTVYSYAQTTDGDLKYKLKGRTRGEETNLLGLVITAERDGNQTSALVMEREDASDDFLPTEDTETFITSDFENVPTVYTLCGRLATTINSIHEFRSLPLGVESSSDAPCVLTFYGVEMLGDSIAFYDAVEQTLTPLKSGMQVSVSGQTQNRYYLVRSLIKKEAAEETHIQIFTEGLTAKVIASTAEPIISVRCFDTAGRLLHRASPQTPEYSFGLPMAGIYIIEAETENDRKTKKVMVK